MPPLDRMRLTTIGEDGLGPGVVLAQGTVFFLYAMGYLAAQISAFDFAGGFGLGGRLNDLPPRPMNSMVVPGSPFLTGRPKRNSDSSSLAVVWASTSSSMEDFPRTSLLSMTPDEE